MLQAFVITLREGIEAFLIVGISLAYLRRSGRPELGSAVRLGILLALALSAVGGYFLYNAENQEWLEGPLAIVAAISVTSLTIHMWRAGRHIKGDIEQRLQRSSERAGVAAFIGVLLFTTLMISREGMETVLLLLQLRQTLDLALGAALGFVGAGIVAWMWTKFGHRVNLPLFLQMTAIFLLVFVVQLFIAGIHEMSEQGYLPFSDPIHAATESWGPDSVFGHLLTYLLVILPLGWLAFKTWVSSASLPKPPSLPKASFPTTSATR
jgi:high-affinity iron transporter